MNRYRIILVAIDLTEESTQVAERALSIGQSHNSALHIVHVIEPINLFYNDNILVDLTSMEQEVERQAKLQLQKFGAHFQIAEPNQHLLLGSPAKKIHALAGELGADLIVVGSHSLNGFSILLGSIASGVLHGSKCDVLAVRVVNH